MIVDKTKLVGESRLDEHCRAFVTHSAVHKNDRLSRYSIPDFQFHAIAFGSLLCLPGHFCTSWWSANSLCRMPGSSLQLSLFRFSRPSVKFVLLTLESS